METIPRQENFPNLEIVFGQDQEMERIKYALGKIDWFMEKGYSIDFPDGLDPKRRDITDDEIKDSVSKEWDEEAYRLAKEEIESGFSKKITKLTSIFGEMSLAIEPKYVISLSRYGGGGSFGFPNLVAMNFRNKAVGLERLAMVVLHEMTHLAIGGLIKKYGIEHWVKERLVDLIMKKAFPEEAHIQKSRDDSLIRVNEVFEENYPNIEEIVKKLA